MPPEVMAPALQACRHCGAGAPPAVHFCPQCSKLLPLGRGLDYFSFFGLPRRLAIEPGDLERRFRALSRQLHPDYFYNADPAERRASLERTSYLNDGYRTLRDPASRLEYLLRLEGVAPTGPGSGGGAREAPAALLEEVFALNEELEAVRALRAAGAPPEQWKPRLERARRPIEARRAEHERELASLAARWDACADPAPAREPEHAAAAVRGGSGPARGLDDDCRAILTALRDRLLERRYIENLLAGIDRELAGP